MTFEWILILAVIVYFAKGLIIVQQAEAVIVERLGKFERELTPGLNFIFPIWESPRRIAWKITTRGPNGESYSYIKEKLKIDLREAVYDFPRQNVITKDNVTISINALLYFQIVNAKSAVYEIQNLPEAIEKLTQTTLRNLVGAIDLDETLVSRDKINHELRAILDEATSALDNQSEALVQDSMERLCSGRTTIIIAHRLSTVRNADTICCLRGGKIVEAGTHKELLALGGYYKELYSMHSF